ncbi:MAG TPA: hypothetical protein VMU83_00130 [Hanamia sp.]|nr:hypothetical protein [Hanamia sp.]
MNRQIQYIRSEYSYKIRAARKDKSLTKSQRKQQILSLKSEREKAINNAEVNFRQRSMNYRRGMDNKQNPGTNENKTPGTNNNNNQNSKSSDSQSS